MYKYGSRQTIEGDDQDGKLDCLVDEEWSDEERGDGMVVKRQVRSVAVYKYRSIPPVGEGKTKRVR